jgi:glucosylceramidase
MTTTRRNFLRAAGISAVAMANPLLAQPAAGLVEVSNSQRPWTIQAWVTDDDRRLLHAPPLDSSAPADTIAEYLIEVDVEQKFQTILGFGAAFTDGSCYLLNELSPAVREELFHRLFHPSEMGLSVCRTCIGSSDHSASLYSFNDGDADPELTRFSIDHDRSYIIPILHEARRISPDLFLLSSPWSPPGWMKDNDSMLGGCMRHTYMPSYANYFVRFLQEYEKAGVPIQAVTVQNEVDADQQGMMPACFWPQDYEADFVRLHLGPTFERHRLSTKIWIIDHNYNLWGRAIAELETAGVHKYTNSVAWHGYSGNPEWMMRVQNAFPELEMHWTEGSPDHDDPEYLKCWATWGQKFSDILQNGCRSITGWCLLTDERGKPNIGPYPLGGLMTIDSKTKQIYHSGQYWALEHFSRFIKRGAVRLQTRTSMKEVAHCAFANPDGSLTIVLTNSGAARACELLLKGNAAKLSLSANSITTLLYSQEGGTT